MAFKLYLRKICGQSVWPIGTFKCSLIINFELYGASSLFLLKNFLIFVTFIMLHKVWDSQKLV